MFADIFITEISDPQNSSDAGRYVELYNSGPAIDFYEAGGWALQRWTNGNADPQSPVSLTGSIAAGGFYVVCNDADKYSTTFGFHFCFLGSSISLGPVSDNPYKFPTPILYWHINSF